jgi:hypothetical protein
MSSKWLHWTDKSTESSHHSEVGFVGFVGSPQGSSEIIRAENHEMIFNTPYQEPSKPTKPDVEPEITGIPADHAHNSLKDLVGAPGFEPGASCAQGRRATRLRYAPT